MYKNTKCLIPERLIITYVFFLGIFSSHVLAECSLKSSWEDWEPYQYQANGNITGLDNDLVKAIIANTQCKLSFVKRPWARALKEIEQGTVDLAPGASINAERELYAHFSLPYRDETMVLMVRKGESPTYPFNSIKDIVKHNFKLGVVRDYYYGEDHKSAMGLPDYAAKVSDVKNDTVNIQKLTSKRIDGLLIDRYVGPYLAKQLGVFDKIEVHPLKINSDNIYLMLSKKSVSQETVNEINLGLEKLKEDGQYSEILKKYLE